MSCNAHNWFGFGCWTNAQAAAFIVACALLVVVIASYNRRPPR